MTVQELINKLAKFDGNTKVMVSAIYDSGCCETDGDIHQIDVINGIIFLTTNEDSQSWDE